MSKIIVPRLYDYQRVGKDKMLAMDPIRALLADDMGLGKTAQVCRTLLEKRAFPALIVVPAPLRIYWQEELYRFARLESRTLYGLRPNQAADLLRRDRVNVIDYDVLANWRERLESVQYKFLVADEGQKLTGRSSKRSIAFRLLGRSVPNIIIATGTPVMNYPSELWPIVSCLWPEEFDSDFDFYTRYCATGEKAVGRYVWSGAKNLQSLYQRLIRCGMIRRLKSEVLTQLPPKRRIVVPLPIERPEEYDRANRDFLAWLATWADMVKARTATRALQFARFGYMKRLAAELKLNAALSWLENWLESCDKKIIVFGIHREAKPFTLKRVYERFKSVAVEFHGGMSDREKEIAKIRFRDDPKCRMFVCQIKAGGVGLNLQTAQAVAHLELDLNPTTHSQATARAHRLGQKYVVDEYFLLANVAIERKHCELLQRKQMVANQVLDGTRDNINSLNLLDELTEALLGNAK